MASLTREQFIQKRATATKVLEIEGVGAVRVRELTIAEVKELQTFEGKNVEAAQYVLTRAMVDDAGNPVLKPDDTEALDAIGIGTMNKIVSGALEFCGVKDAAGPKA